VRYYYRTVIKLFWKQYKYRLPPGLGVQKLEETGLVIYVCKLFSNFWDTNDVSSLTPHSIIILSFLFAASTVRASLHTQGKKVCFNKLRRVNHVPTLIIAVFVWRNRKGAFVKYLEMNFRTRLEGQRNSTTESLEGVGNRVH
jgi:hypothetical protein